MRAACDGPGHQRREPDIRDFFTWLFTPLARRLGGVHPDVLTGVSILTGCLAGLSFWLARHGDGFYLAGGALVAVSGACDSLDGLVARLHGRTSLRGDFLDHFGDRLVNVAIFAGLAFSPGACPALGLGTVILVMLNSYLGTQIEATFGVRYYGGLGKAELFVALIAIAVLLPLLKDLGVTVAGVRIVFVNLAFVALALLTAWALVLRLRHALRLCAEGEDRPR
jgi:archaetidylinositol phosphate synthase